MLNTSRKNLFKFIYLPFALLTLIPTLSLAAAVECKPTADTNLPYQSYVGYHYILGFACTSTLNYDIPNFMAVSTVSSNAQFVLDPVKTTCPTSAGKLAAGDTCVYSGIFTPGLNNNQWYLKLAYLNQPLFNYTIYNTQGIPAPPAAK